MTKSTIVCNECYKRLNQSELAYYPLQWQHSGDMYCHKHETREQFKQPVRVSEVHNTTPIGNKHRDLSDLTPQLIDLEGYRVEVLDNYGDTRRFIVGRSTGWKPCHLEVSRRSAYGGYAASKSYQSVTILYKAR